MKSTDILIIVDLEGIIGMKKGVTKEYARFLMIRELQYVVNTITEYNELCSITICDVHNDGTLLSNGLVATNIKCLNGINKLTRTPWNYDIAMLIGFHAMANQGGIFDHTFRSDIEGIYLESTREAIGEISGLVLFSENKGVPVIFISGEGNFENEVSTKKIPIHKVNDKDDLDKQYKELCNFIAISLESHINPVVSHEKQRVFVRVDNSDKVLRLQSDGFSISDKEVVFDSIEDFFLNLYRFGDALNRATSHIIKENLQLARRIQMANIGKGECENIMQLLSKPISMINEEDRLMIRQSLNL